MARSIRWSEDALTALLEILEFWTIHNESNAYSRNLYSNIINTVDLLAEFPELGKATQIRNVRALIFANYRIIYQVEVSDIEVLLLRDDRMNPEAISF